METQNQNVPLVRNASFKEVQDMIAACPSSAQIFDLPAVRDSWIRKYTDTTGKRDGAMQFEGNKVRMLQMLRDNWGLGQCSKESIYNVWVDLAICGLPLAEGLCYVVPYGKKATFQIGWKGRLEQIMEIPTVISVDDPQVVYSDDTFEFVLGVRPDIVKHQPAQVHAQDAIITHAYVVIYHDYGHKVHIMDRKEILNIRDTRSQSYKQYLKDINNANEEGKVQRNGSNGIYWADIEKPMWVTDEAQSFRKTLIKRVYNNAPKLAHHKRMDERLREQTEELRSEGIQVDEETGEVWQDAQEVGKTEPEPAQVVQQAADPVTTQQQPTQAQQQGRAEPREQQQPEPATLTGAGPELPPGGGSF